MHDLLTAINIHTVKTEGSGFGLNNFLNTGMGNAPPTSLDLDLYSLKSTPSWIEHLQSPKKNGHRIAWFGVLVLFSAGTLMALPYRETLTLIFGTLAVLSFLFLLVDPFYDVEDWKMKMKVYADLKCCSNCKTVTDKNTDYLMAAHNVQWYLEIRMKQMKKDRTRK